MKEESENVVTVKPGKDGIRHSCDGTGVRVPDGVPEEVGEKGEDQRPEDIPDRHIEEGLGSPSEGLKQVVEDECQDDQNTYVNRPDEFCIFPILGMSHGKGNHSNGNSKVPQPQRQFPKPFTVKWSSEERRDKIMRHSQESCSHKPEHSDIGMNLSNPAEDDPRDVSREDRAPPVRWHQ